MTVQESVKQDSVDACVADITAHFAAIDPDVEGAVDGIDVIGKHIGRAFQDTLARHALSHGEYKLLSRLRSRAGGHQMSAGELSRSQLLSSGAMTNRLDRLESAGLVRRL